MKRTLVLVCLTFSFLGYSRLALAQCEPDCVWIPTAPGGRLTSGVNGYQYHIDIASDISGAIRTDVVFAIEGWRASENINYKMPQIEFDPSGNYGEIMFFFADISDYPDAPEGAKAGSQHINSSEHHILLFDETDWPSLSSKQRKWLISHELGHAHGEDHLTCCTDLCTEETTIMRYPTSQNYAVDPQCADEFKVWLLYGSPW